jgi:hypothetical protein
MFDKSPGGFSSQLDTAHQSNSSPAPLKFRRSIHQICKPSLPLPHVHRPEFLTRPSYTCYSASNCTCAYYHFFKAKRLAYSVIWTSINVIMQVNRRDVHMASIYAGQSCHWIVRTMHLTSIPVSRDALRHKTPLRNCFVLSRNSCLIQNRQLRIKNQI